MIPNVSVNYVRKLLKDAEEAGFKLAVRCDGEVDYAGFHAAEAEDSIRAVDEAVLLLREGNGAVIGSALIVNSLEPEEQIADTSGEWLEAWLLRNFGLGGTK